ncbi:NAD-dependent epimerase/dehydratase family protein [Bradyrhizobium sacchari]|uniref:NAD-dependent epimerase/dehydratase family protein n=1 Tax=Bradyrhizobium sacchari TaxID=1399419 RepID=UPI003221B968
MGERPLGVPNHLLPFVAQVAADWEDDYEMPDGTGISDFIHVVDLASGHLSALRHLGRPGVLTINLGTGNGSSVLDVVRTFEAASGRSVP